MDRFGVPCLDLLLSQVVSNERMLDPDDMRTERLGGPVARLDSIAHVGHMMLSNAITSQLLRRLPKVVRTCSRDCASSPDVVWTSSWSVGSRAKPNSGVVEIDRGILDQMSSKLGNDIINDDANRDPPI